MTKEIVDRRYQKFRAEPYAPHGTLIPGPGLGLGYTLFYIYTIVLVYRDILCLLDEYY